MIRRTLKIKTGYYQSLEGDFEKFTPVFMWGFAFLPISGLNEGCPYDNRYQKHKTDTGQKLKGGKIKK